MDTDALEKRPSSSISITNRINPILAIDDSSKPKDRFHILYLAFLFQGMAILFPYNAFIFLLDFYLEKFCDLHLFYWSMVTITIVSNALFCLLTNILSEYISPAKRILTGHLLYLVSLAFFLIFSSLVVGNVLETLPNTIGYTPLLAGLITGVGIGISQPSYYSISSQLPSRYTQALIIGETVSGVTSACFRVSTKLLKLPGSCQYYDTLVYISLTLVVMISSIAVWAFIYFHRYTKYHLDQLNKEKFSIEYRVVEQDTGDSSMEVSIANECVDNYPDESTLLFGIPRVAAKEKLISNFERFKKSVLRRYIVFKKTCFLQLTLFVNFVITLFLFPTFITAAYKCHTTLCDWVPIMALTVFVFSDFVIRWFTLIRIRLKNYVIFLISLSRVLFIPLICLFIFPLENAIMHVDYGLPIFLIIVSLFGLTNGYFGSVPLVIIPIQLKGGDKQLGSSMGIFMLVSALVVGSLLAFPFNETVLIDKSTNMTTSFCCYKNNITNSLGGCMC